MSLRALIFDVDGTLADTEELHRQAFNAAFVQHGLPWHWGRRAYAELLQVTGGKERIEHFIALTGGSAANKAHLAKLIPAIHATKTQAYTDMVASGSAPLRPGVAELIDDARGAGLRIAIASTTTPANIDALIRGTMGADAVKWFSTIAAGDAVAHKKPAPDIYSLALEGLQLPAAVCLAFEDSANGLAAAKAAELCTIVAPTTWTADDDLSAADLLVSDLSECGLSSLSNFHSDWLAQRAVAA